MTMCGNNSDSSSDYYHERANLLEELNRAKKETIELKNESISTYEEFMDNLREQASDSESADMVNVLHNLANMFEQTIVNIKLDIENLENDIDINEDIIEDFRSLTD